MHTQSSRPRSHAANRHRGGRDALHGLPLPLAAHSTSTESTVSWAAWRPPPPNARRKEQRWPTARTDRGTASLVQSAKQIFHGADVDGDRSVDADEFYAHMAENTTEATTQTQVKPEQTASQSLKLVLKEEMSDSLKTGPIPRRDQDQGRQDQGATRRDPRTEARTAAPGRARASARPPSFDDHA